MGRWTHSASRADPDHPGTAEKRYNRANTLGALGSGRRLRRLGLLEQDRGRLEVARSPLAVCLAAVRATPDLRKEAEEIRRLLAYMPSSEFAQRSTALSLSGATLSVAQAGPAIYPAKALRAIGFGRPGVDPAKLDGVPAVQAPSDQRVKIASMEQVAMESDGAGEGAPEPGTALDSLPENTIIDFITDKPVKDSPKEQVRQRIARALFHEYSLSVEDMLRDFPIPATSGGARGRKKKADIAIFAHGAEKTFENLRRVVICKPEPKNGNSVTKIRTYDQATKDLNELKELMGDEANPGLRYGLWTNGLDFFFYQKEVGRFGASFEPRADWPLADETVGSRTVASHAHLRRGEAGMLKTAFRRCHNYIHGNEGMSKDAAFWQFLYLLFAKMHDEQTSRAQGTTPRFYAGFDEPFTTDGQKKIRRRVDELFAEVKSTYPLFSARDEITLSDRALAFLVAELAPYDLEGTDIDAKGIAYQELVGPNLRGDRGQYFTPRSAVRLMVEILDPKEHEIVLDPACGTGGFLRETLNHLLNGWREAEGTLGLPDTEEQLKKHRERLMAYASAHLFGADYDPALVRTTKLNVMILAGIEGNIYYMDSLAFPKGHLPGVQEARRLVDRGTVDVLMTNPPFGAEIKVTDQETLEQYRDGVAQTWTRDKESFLPVASSKAVSAMAPEQLFIQRAVEWVREGGRIGIVLPNGILSNPGHADEAIRRWILEHCWVLASIELPMETFTAEADVNIVTTLLFLKKKTEKERIALAMGVPQDYPVFMALAERVGFDRRGNTVYKRHPDGEVVLEVQVERERIRINGKSEIRTLYRRRRVVDDDLPEIAKRYREFRTRYPEPRLS